MSELETAGQSESFFPFESGETETNSTENSPYVKMDGERMRSEDARLAAVMSYIPFLCFVPLMTMRHNPEAVFHARQGLILFLIELGAAILTIDKVSDFLFRGVLVAAMAAAATGVYLALQGRHYRLPIVGTLAEKTQL